MLRQTVAVMKLCPLLPSLGVTQRRAAIAWGHSRCHPSKGTEPRAVRKFLNVQVLQWKWRMLLQLLPLHLCMEANSQDAEADLQAAEDLDENHAEEDFAADEEAAKFMMGYRIVKACGVGHFHTVAQSGVNCA